MEFSYKNPVKVILNYVRLLYSELTNFRIMIYLLIFVDRLRILILLKSPLHTDQQQ